MQEENEVFQDLFQRHKMMCIQTKGIFKIQGFYSFLLVWCRERRMGSNLTRKQIGVFFAVVSCS